MTSIRGVWDLPMIGAETINVEHEYQNLTDGPAVNLQCLDGCFVQSATEEIFQLQESNEENQFLAGSRAFCKKLEAFLDEKNFSEEETAKFLSGLRKARQDFVERKKSQPVESNYYPSNGLPEDSVLVVRTSALRKFEQLIADSDNKDTKSVKESTRKTENLLRAITAIAIDDYGYRPESAKSTAPQDIADAISKQGVNFDPKTIRGWLKEGASLLDVNLDKD